MLTPEKGAVLLLSSISFSPRCCYFSLALRIFTRTSLRSSLEADDVFILLALACGPLFLTLELYLTDFMFR